MDPNVLLAIPLLPLAAAIIAGLFGKLIGRTAAHVVTIAAVGLSFLLSAQVAWQLISGEVGAYNAAVYTWLVSDGIRMEVGFLVDHLSVLMMCVVTFVSFCVHVYTIGYMHEDPGYPRFFSFLVHATERDLREHEGVSRQPRRRFRLRAGYRGCRLLHGFA